MERGVGGVGGVGTWSEESRSELSITCNWRLSNFYDIKPRVFSSPLFKVRNLDFVVQIYPKGDTSAVKKGYISLSFMSQNDCLLEEDVFVRFGVKVFDVENGRIVENEVDDWSGRLGALNQEVHVSKFLLRSKVRDCKTLDVRVSVQILEETFDVDYGTIGANPGISTASICWKIPRFSSLIDLLRKNNSIISGTFMVGDRYFTICICQYKSKGDEDKNTDNVTFILSLVLQSERFQDLIGKSVLIAGHLTVHNGGAVEIVQGFCDRYIDDFMGNERIDCSTAHVYNCMEMDELPDFLLEDDVAYFKCLLYLVSDASTLTDIKGQYGGKFQWTVRNFGELLKLLQTNSIDTSGVHFPSKSFSIGEHHYGVYFSFKGDKFSVFVRNSKPVYAFYKLSLLNRLKEVIHTKEMIRRHSIPVGWDYYVSIHKLLDEEKWGLLAEDAIVMSLEVLFLKEGLSIMEGSTTATWTVENWTSLKEVMGNNKICSNFFEAFGYQFRIVFSHSGDSLDVYLESKECYDNLVMYRITLDKDCQASSLLITEENRSQSVLSFKKVSKTSLVFVCEILKVLDLTNFAEKTEPHLQLPVIKDLIQMECSPEDYRTIVCQSHEILIDAFDDEDGVLAAIIVLILRAASKCELVKEVVELVRKRMKSLGSDVSKDVLKSLSKALVRSDPCVSDAMLDSIDDEDTEICFSDIYVLVEMMTRGRLDSKAAQTLAKALSLNKISSQGVDSVLKKRQAMGADVVADVKKKNKKKSAFHEPLLRGAREVVETTAAAVHSKLDQAVTEIKEGMLEMILKEVSDETGDVMDKSAFSERLLDVVREKLGTTAAAIQDKVDEALADIKGRHL